MITKKLLKAVLNPAVGDVWQFSKSNVVITVTDYEHRRKVHVMTRNKDDRALEQILDYQVYVTSIVNLMSKFPFTFRPSATHVRG